MAGRSVSQLKLAHFELIVGPRLTGSPHEPNLSCAVDGNADATMKNVAAVMKIDAFMSEPSLETAMPF